MRRYEGRNLCAQTSRSVRLSLRLTGTVWVALFSVQILLAEGLGWPEPQIISVYVDVRGPNGTSQLGLALSDFAVLENGVERQVRRFREIDALSGEVSTASQRFFILYFSDKLDMHQEFSSKRLAKEFIRNLLPDRDALAVIRDRAISGFTQDVRQMKRLVDYFATEGDRYGFGPPEYGKDDYQPHWYGLELGKRSSVSTHDDAFHRMLRLGSFGEFSTLLSGLRELPGRKILLVFGDTNPFEVTDLAHFEVEAAARLTADAAVTVFVLSPERSRQLINRETRSVSPGKGDDRFLQIWAESSGGNRVGADSDRDAVVDQVLGSLAHYYYLEYQPEPALDGHFRRIEVRSRVLTSSLACRAGYFATIPVAVHLRGRTFQTVLQRPQVFSDLPLQIDADRTAADRLAVTLAFPFHYLQLEELEPEKEDSPPRLFQALHFFIGAFDSSGRLRGFQEGLSTFLLTEKEWLAMRGQRAKIIEEFPVHGEVDTIVGVLTVGQNRQISAQVLFEQDGLFSTSPRATTEGSSMQRVDPDGVPGTFALSPFGLWNGSFRATLASR